MTILKAKSRLGVLKGPLCLSFAFNYEHSFQQIGGVLYMYISFCCHTCSAVLTSPRMRGSVGTGVPLIILVKVP
jgi:hypothetical protein